MSDFTPVSAPQWIAEALAAPDQQWLVKGLVPSAGITIIAGRPKIGKKSFLAQLIALVVASGHACDHLTPSGPGLPVLYIDREGTLKPTAQRYAVLSQTMQVPISENLHIAFNVPFKMDVEASISHVRALVREMGIKLCIIDTLAKSMSGDENSAKDMGAALLCAEALKYDGCAVIIVHHLNRAARLQPGEYMDQASGLRGSTALEGAYDQILSVQQATVEGERNLYLVRGGKFQGAKAAVLDWHMESDADDVLTVARLNLGPWDELPMQDEAVSTSRSPSFSKKV